MRDLLGYVTAESPASATPSPRPACSIAPCTPARASWPRRVYVCQRLTDLVAHRWDLAWGLGLDGTIADDIADYLHGMWQPHADELAASGLLAPPVAVPADASPSDRLLGCSAANPERGFSNSGPNEDFNPWADGPLRKYEASLFKGVCFVTVWARVTSCPARGRIKEGWVGRVGSVRGCDSIQEPVWGCKPVTRTVSRSRLSFPGLPRAGARRLSAGDRPRRRVGA